MNTYDLVDVYRNVHVDTRWYSWRRFNGTLDSAEKEKLHRVEFRSRFKKKGESVTEYGFALNRIASDAYPRMPPEARETIVIDQFVSGLPSKDLRRHVQFHHPS